jgi:hypothetical protein
MYIAFPVVRLAVVARTFVVCRELAAYTLLVVTYVSEFVVVTFRFVKNALSTRIRVVVSSDETFKRLMLERVLTLRVVKLAKGVERDPVLIVRAWSESTLAPSTTLRPNVPVLVV